MISQTSIQTTVKCHCEQLTIHSAVRLRLCHWVPVVGLHWTVSSHAQLCINNTHYIHRPPAVSRQITVISQPARPARDRKMTKFNPSQNQTPKLIAKKIVTLRRSAMPNLVEISSWWYLFSLPSLQVRPLNGYWRTI